MITQNQFYGDNLQRDYPFQKDTALPYGVFVDAVFRVTVDSEVLAGTNALRLISLNGAGGAIRFEIIGGPMAGASFRGTIPAVPTLYERVRLNFYDVTSTPQPGMGYGYVILGDATVPTGPRADAVEPGAIRYLESGITVSFRLANAICKDDTVVSETVGGVAGTLTFQGRTENVVERCVEVAVVPPAEVTQKRMSPDVQGATVTPVAIPRPMNAVTVYETAATTVVTARALNVSDSIPAGPGFDAAPVGSAALGAAIEAGHNIKLTGSIRDGVIWVGYVIGAGAGVNCADVPGCTPGVPSTAALKSINGVSGENLEFVRGTAVDVLASPGDHTLYFIVHPEKLSRATS